MTAPSVEATYARYSYLGPSKPPPGNRRQAEQKFTSGVEAHKARRFGVAMDSYQAAARVDPSYFEAYYNLALAAYEAGDLRQSLVASEYALALNPEAADARYNFALVLQRARYPYDAANELERLLAVQPLDARAHLNLANLYSQTLNQPARARVHYQQVLELEPRHPQASAIRYWLTTR